MMWWNRRDFVNHAEPDEVAKILKETTDLTHEMYRRDEIEARLSVDRDRMSLSTLTRSTENHRLR